MSEKRHVRMYSSSLSYPCCGSKNTWEQSFGSCVKIRVRRAVNRSLLLVLIPKINLICWMARGQFCFDVPVWTYSASVQGVPGVFSSHQRSKPPEDASTQAVLSLFLVEFYCRTCADEIAYVSVLRSDHLDLKATVFFISQEMNYSKQKAQM